MVCMLVLSVVDCFFKSMSGHRSNLILKIGICCLATKHVALRSRSKDEDNVSEWSNIYIDRKYRM
jgi:hypothetical protein